MGLVDGIWDDGYYNKTRAFYDKALVCPNGHIINDSISECPENNVVFCEKCGGKAKLKTL